MADRERERAAEGFAAATASAIERGIYMAGKTPLGYVRGPDRRLVPDPETAPVVLAVFERRAKGWSWVRLARWLGEQGHLRTESGVKGIVHNPAYLGQARYGATVKDDAHEAIVPRGLWRKCQEPGRKSARSGRLTERYLLQGIAICANCGRAMYLSGGNRHGKDYEHYVCRRIECDSHAYARAHALDSYVLNVIEARVNEADPSQWVARPGDDDAEAAEAESAAEEARADLDAYLANTTLLRQLGPERYNATVSDYMAALNKAEADLAAAREASTGGFELVGRLWNTEWGWAERKEWVERMVRSVVVLRGREPLSRRVQVELR